MRLISLLDASTIVTNDEDKVLVFDIDNTLYKETLDLVKERRKAGYEFLNTFLNMSFEEFCSRSSEYTKKYGTNYKGFIENYDIPESFFEGLNECSNSLEQFLTPNSKINDYLKSLPYIKVCFTNSTRKQSEEILKCLGMDSVIDAMIYCEYREGSEIICKPMKESYENVNKMINPQNNKTVYFFDDMEENIDSGRKNGWRSTKVDNYELLYELVSVSIQN